MATKQQLSRLRGQRTRTFRNGWSPNFRLLMAVGAAALVVLAVTALLPRTATTRALACSGADAKTGLDVGQCAPDFTLSDLRGKRVSLASFRGHPVLLHFWAAGCSTCKAEYPDFLRVVAAYRPRGLDVLAVDAWGETLPLVQDWQDGHHLPATLLVDPSTGVASMYHGTGTPTTYLIDRAGRVAFGQTGPLSYAVYQHQIDKVL